MTRKELVKTTWAKNFKKTNPMDYDDAIDIAMDNTVDVGIYKTDQTGEWRWAIDAGNGFWLDSFKTKKEAVSLCKKMGWKIL